MANYQLSNKAVIDLEEIWDYTLYTWSENQAEIYFNQIIKTCSVLAKNPQIGKSYSEIRNKLFGFRTGKHIIFYESFDENEIIVFRILHEQMDLEIRLIE